MIPTTISIVFIICIGISIYLFLLKGKSSLNKETIPSVWEDRHLVVSLGSQILKKDNDEWLNLFLVDHGAHGVFVEPKWQAWNIDSRQEDTNKLLKFIWIPPDPNIEAALIEEGKAGITIAYNVPGSYTDLIDEMKLYSPVREQFDETCVGFAVTGLMEFLYGQKNSANRIVLTPLDLFCKCKEFETDLIINPLYPCLFDLDYEEDLNYDITERWVADGMYCEDIAVNRDYAYVASGETGLQIIDIKDPYYSNSDSCFEPYEVDSNYNIIQDVSTKLIVAAIDRVDHYIITSTSNVGIGTTSPDDTLISFSQPFFDNWDIGNPNQSIKNIFDLCCSGSFLEDQNSHPEKYEIVLLDIIDTKNYAYVADKYSGLQVIDIRCPGLQIFGGYPTSMMFGGYAPLIDIRAPYYLNSYFWNEPYEPEILVASCLGFGDNWVYACLTDNRDCPFVTSCAGLMSSGRLFSSGIYIQIYETADPNDIDFTFNLNCNKHFGIYKRKFMFFDLYVTSDEY